MGVDIQNSRNIPQARKGVKKVVLLMCEGQGKNCFWQNTNSYPGLSLALRTRPEKDLLPSAILKEMNAMKSAGLLLVWMPIHRNEKILLQVILFILKCSIYSCQMFNLHPAFQPSSAFTGPKREENKPYFYCNSIWFRIALSSTFLTLHRCWSRLLLFQHFSFGFNHFIKNSSPNSVHFLISLSSL